VSDPSHTPLEYATPPARPRRRFGLVATLVVLAFLLGVAVPLLVVQTRRYTAVGTVANLMPTGYVTAPPTSLPTVTSRVRIVQRDEQPVPGTDGGVVARIGDITGGQTLLTVNDAQGNVLVNTVSMRVGDSTTFTVAASTFEVELVELNNFVTGDDLAVFDVRQAGAMPGAPAVALSEEQKIARLIDGVASEPGVAFIRNGTPHSGAEAANQLNRKYQSAGGKGITARQFIEKIASRSSLSGEEYRVKLPDDSERSAGEWLTERLQQIEGAAAPTTATTPTGGR
jgi:hypothetical protein